MEWNPECVFSAVDCDGVEVGDIVYAANTVRALRDEQDAEQKGYLTVVKEILDDSYEKVFRVESLARKEKGDFAFVYKLSTRENRKAFEYWWAYGSGNNHNLEYCTDLGNGWNDVPDGEPPIGFAYEGYHYRVKELYRPYENSKELVDDWLKKNGGCHSALAKPTIWLKSKVSGAEYMVQALTEHGVVLPAVTLSTIVWEKLFEKYTFLDGSEVGLLKEEK
jgi:hypothetical protein